MRRPIRWLPAAQCVFSSLLLTVPARGADEPTNRAMLHVADGFEVERVAASPLVLHPIMAAFDDLGRLYVGDNSGENLDARQLAAKNPGRIRRLDDTDGDGKFDVAITFATGLTMPTGAQWHDGALYVAAPPDILRLEDADGDGFAEHRRVIVSGFVYNGNGADNHGPYLGPDGWLYFTHGRHGYRLPTREGTVLDGLASQVFRCLPDGRNLQRVCGGGMDNPVEVAFLRTGEMFGTLTFYSEPVGGRRDALVHWVEGGVYPKVHECLKEFTRSGPLLPALRHWPAVAPSGLMLVRGRAIRDDAVGELVTAQFNTACVQRHPIHRDGATFRVTDHDLLRSTAPDFHPTDVLEDGDGSVLVVDTGGWFRRGCPRSVIAKPDVLGAIYRVRAKDAPRVADPWGRAIAWPLGTPRQLVELLGDRRFAVRDRAVAELARRGDAAVALLAQALATAANNETRVQAVWALAMIGTPTSATAVRRGLEDANADVRIAACRAAGLARDREAQMRLAEMVVSDDPAVRRQAATALGQIGPGGSPTAPALLVGLESMTTADPFLEHALIQALIDGNDLARTRPGLRDPAAVVRRGALVALDQMAHGALAPSEVLPFLDDADAAMRSTAMTVIERHPSWAPEIRGALANWLRRAERDATADESLRRLLLAFEADAAVQSWMAESLGGQDATRRQRLLLLDVISRSRRPTLPGPWLEALGACLGSNELDVRRETLAAIRVQRVSRLDDRLETIAYDDDEPADIRLAAVGILGGRMSRLSPDLFLFLTGRLVRETAPLERLGAAEVLGAVPLSGEQAIALAGRLADADPLVIAPLLHAYRRTAGADVGRALLAALRRRADAGLGLPADLADVLKSYPAAIASEASPMLERLDAGNAKAKAMLEGLATTLQGGNPGRGRNVFFGNKANCYACHRVGNDGGTVGPDLTTIGAVRSRRDLVEAVVYPSASFAQGFEPVKVATSDGRVLGGVIARQDGGSVVLRTADRAEVRLRPEEVEEIRRSDTSIMPQGLDAILSPEELRDLLSYLQQRK
jgi:putative heme-binding domain-containing protein